MSIFSIFGGKPKKSAGSAKSSGSATPSPSPSASSAEASLVKMRETLEVMEKKEAHLETKIQAELNLAKQYVTTKPEGTFNRKISLII